MSELETQLRRLATNGELTYLSIVPSAGKGENGVIFVAQVSPASNYKARKTWVSYSEGRDADPVKAILKAIEGLPKLFVKGEPQRPGEEGFTSVSRVGAEPWDTA